MDDLPAVKAPSKFTGQGFEIIGDPSDSPEQATLWFQDGVFAGFQLLGNEIHTPGSEWQKRTRRITAERLALSVSENPDDTQARADLKAILKQCREETPRDRSTERAVKSIKNGGPATNWPARIRRERVAVIALMETATEYGRPPTESEVIARMMAFAEDQDGSQMKVLQGGERKHLAELLREFGFSWLERSPRGRPRI